MTKTPHFCYPQKVLFKHCDPAGICFYPRLFEMINDAIEAFFCEALDWPFEKIHPNSGVPTVSFNIKFLAPCFLGERLTIEIEIERIGRSSLELLVCAKGTDQTRFEGKQVLVCIGKEGRPQPWPDAVAEKLNSLL